MKRLILWLVLLAVGGFGLRARAAAPETNQVQAADLGWYGSTNAMGAQSVRCRSILTMPPEGEGVYTCRLSPGLGFDAVTALTVKDGEVNAAFYTVVTARQGEDAFSLHVSPLAARPGETLTVEYTLTLTDDAEGENFFSVDASGESSAAGCVRLLSLTASRAVILPETGSLNPVSGACLCLSYDREGRDRVAFRSRGEDTYLACAAEGCGHARHYYVLKTPRSGRVYLEGLCAGTYYLSETRPVEGTTETAQSVEIILTPEGEVWVDGALSPDGAAALTHTAGASQEEARHFTLLDFYRRGSEVLAMALLALVAARRYYI